VLLVPPDHAAGHVTLPPSGELPRLESFDPVRHTASLTHGFAEIRLSLSGVMHLIFRYVDEPAARASVTYGPRSQQRRGQV
jgi:hypothetical protein